MSTRIGLIGDVHACAEPLEEALKIFEDQKVDMVLCTGDVTGYGTETEQVVFLLRDINATVLLGNHEAWYLERPATDQDSGLHTYFSGLPSVWESVIEGLRVYAVHASPPDSLMRGVKLLDENGKMLTRKKEYWADGLSKYAFDVLIVGHTHQVFAEKFGDKLVINPGSTKFNHTCAILRLPEMDVAIFPLSGKKPVLSWNWGMIAGV